MRLIDADEFRDDIFRQSEFIKVDDFQVLPVVDVAECLDNAPTVMAIPIEWIEKFMNRFRLGMVTSDEYALLHFMLTEWENENE